jgi:two-component system sensor histidine kinase/response regulator
MEATAAIRESEKATGKHIPIIAMTAHAMRGDKERYLAGGMDGYVSKPIDPNSLFAEVERCVAGTEGSATMTTHSRDQCEYLDRSSLLERVEGDHELLVEMINLFLEDAPRLLAAMHDALERGDMLVLERTAHSMKGAAGNFSAHITVVAAARVEENAKNGDMASAETSLAALEEAVKQLLPWLVELSQGVSK